MVERLRAIDASFLALDTPVTPQIIGALGVLDGPPVRERVRQGVERLVQSFPRLTSKLTDRPPFAWEPEEGFSLDHHLLFPELSSPLVGERALLELVERYFSAPLALERAPWEIVVFSSPESHDAAFLFRFHHALADGLSGLGMLTAVTEPLRYFQGGREETGSLSRERKGYGLLPWRWSGLKYDGFKSLLRELFIPRRVGVWNGENSDGRRVAILDLDLIALRRAKFRQEVSYNELVLGLVTGAARRYLDKSADTVEELRVLVPVSLRGLGGGDVLGNHLTGVVLHLPVGEGDQMRRLRRIREESVRLRSSGAATAYDLFARACSHLPFPLQRIGARFLARKTSCICTNLPYVSYPRSFGGARLKNLYGFPALMPGHQLALSFIGYAGRTNVAVVSDAQGTIDGERFITALKEEVDELLSRALLGERIPVEEDRRGVERRF